MVMLDLGAPLISGARSVPTVGCGPPHASSSALRYLRVTVDHPGAVALVDKP